MLMIIREQVRIQPMKRQRHGSHAYAISNTPTTYQGVILMCGSDSFLPSRSNSTA